MEQAKFILIGYGWRADFFHRIAKELPEYFRMTGVVLRTKERALQVAGEYSVFATEDLEEALKTDPDFAVLCVPRGIVKDYLIRLMEYKVPVLCETPPGKDVGELSELYREYKRLNGKIQVVKADRDMAVLKFESGRTGFLDFMGEQYFSTIRTRRLNIQGVRGEINDMCIRYLGEDNMAVTEEFHRIDTGIYNNSGFTHQGNLSYMIKRFFLKVSSGLPGHKEYFKKEFGISPRKFCLFKDH